MEEYIYVHTFRVGRNLFVSKKGEQKWAIMVQVSGSVWHVNYKSAVKAKRDLEHLEMGR